jgi:purine catabolism regulator
MTRYRLLRGEAQGQRRVSWVTIPLIVGGAPQPYFCVMESRRFLDFCDEYSMRIAYLALLSIYEQIVALRDSYNVGFEQLVHLALESREEDSHRLHYQANQQGISMEEPYLYVLFQHDHKSMDIRTKRNTVMDLFLHCGMESKGRMAFLSRTEGVILFHTRGNIELERRQISAVLTEFQSKMTRKFEGMEWTFAVSYEPKRLSEIRLCVEKGRKTLKIGSVAFPDRKILDYSDLGILTWLDIPDEELKLLLDDFATLMNAEKNRELLHTLKVYLENNMNYSLTAEKLYVNINTIRRRIEKVNEFVNVDWNNYYTRTKIGLMLQFMQF